MTQVPMDDAIKPNPSEILDQVWNGPRPFALGLGIDLPNGGYEVRRAFATNVLNHEKIRDVMRILTDEGMYVGGSHEIEISNLEDLATLIAAFEDTDHGKMNDFLASIEEGQVAVVAIIIARDDVDAENSFSAAVLAELDNN